ncbi:hypothetical protein RRG08_020258 [Elysia crispata]|uniref:Uncharacterized protein n=1 Tax=Elysia crispata TaxID=231223 RepID=A0AAE1B3E3_9GAST|nr:hypothetical protein RRG08_020258 [Elysia crispata]
MGVTVWLGFDPRPLAPTCHFEGKGGVSKDVTVTLIMGNACLAVGYSWQPNDGLSYTEDIPGNGSQDKHPFTAIHCRTSKIPGINDRQSMETRVCILPSMSVQPHSSNPHQREAQRGAERRGQTTAISAALSITSHD